MDSLFSSEFKNFRENLQNLLEKKIKFTISTEFKFFLLELIEKELSRISEISEIFMVIFDHKIKSPCEIIQIFGLQEHHEEKNPQKKNNFDFDTIPNILGLGITVIEREITKLAAKSGKMVLNDFGIKIFISFINALRCKKDHRRTLSNSKELKSYSDEQLKAMLDKESN